MRVRLANHNEEFEKTFNPIGWEGRVKRMESKEGKLYIAITGMRKDFLLAFLALTAHSVFSITKKNLPSIKKI